MADDRDENPLSRGFGSGYAIVAAGFQLAFAVLLFLGAGLLVDRWLKTRPLFTIAGVLIGLGAGMYALVRSAIGESPPHEGPKDGAA